MFDASETRLFGLPPGVDFPARLLEGLQARLPQGDPLALADVEIFVNTRRMHRRLLDLFDQGPPCLLPQIRLLSDLTNSVSLFDQPPAVSPLQRQLELAQLIEALLDQQPHLAPRSAVFDLAQKLAGLLDELQGEGVSPEALQKLELGHLSAHWEAARQFLEIAQGFAEPGARDPEARNRLAAQRLISQWQVAAPQHPVIVAGSTGSRGTTAMLMQAVLNLPKGAVILPGFDFDMPDTVWESMGQSKSPEDHPQYRFFRLAKIAGIKPAQVQPWVQNAQPPDPARNALVSLALRPAPVTDQWLTAGQNLRNLAETMGNTTLVEAANQREEALAIALVLRKAAEDGATAALISPDRMLTRRVSAALDRWGIVPDDSAGQPLHHSPPGRFLLQLAQAMVAPLETDSLLALLKHPLTSSSPGLRGQHLLWTRELELFLRKQGRPFLQSDTALNWAKEFEDDRAHWLSWLFSSLPPAGASGTAPLGDWLQKLVFHAENLAGGAGQESPGELWNMEAGEKAFEAIQALMRAADSSGDISAIGFVTLLRGFFSGQQVQNPVQAHPGIMIWGTLEARVQGAQVVVLGGLNDGIWPPYPDPDPWLSREMRISLGLLLPERRIGLSAHDFQQAAAARQVVFARSVRDAEAETVPSRWINRLTNLLDGLPDAGGKDALQNMRARGAALLGTARALDLPDAPVAAAPRPAPSPPVEFRPTRLSVTRIQTLIRDPYAIYAERVLKLRALDPLLPEPTPMLRGTVLHKVMDAFVALGPGASKTALLDIAENVMASEVAWASTRRLWLARVARVADWFLENEAARLADSRNIALEVRGQANVTPNFTLTAEADRIDAFHSGGLHIIDYKTGSPPSPKQIDEFDKQLLLEAGIAARGGFNDINAQPVARLTYIGLGGTPKEVRVAIDGGKIEETWAGLESLLACYAKAEQGYSAKRAAESGRTEFVYDHLARFGEWDLGQKAVLLKVAP